MFLSDAHEVGSRRLVVVLVVVALVVWGRIKHQRRGCASVVDPLKLKVPVFGNLSSKIAMARFTRNLGTMLQPGVPILQALDIVAETTGNAVIAGPSATCRTACGRASASPARWRNHTVFPPMVVQMIAVGEDTGAMDTMLAQDRRLLRPGGRGDDRVAHRPDRAADDRRPRRSSAAMIIALYMPIFKVFDLIE